MARNSASIFLLVLFAFSAKLHADIGVNEYQGLKSDPTFKAYVSGVGRGFSYANAELEYRKDPPLFCPPSKLAIQSDNYLDILDRTVSETKGRVRDDFPIEALLLLGLKTTFPCN